MKARRLVGFLIITLTACAPVQTETTDIQNTAIAIVQTEIALTQTAMPTATIPPTFTPTLEVMPALTGTPIPTLLPPPILTPDAIQVERWKDYETALAQSILPMFTIESVQCEWDILARSGEEVYVWAVCASPQGNDWRPAVIHLKVDGSIDRVEIPKRGLSVDIDRMFPDEVQAKFSFYSGSSLFDGRLKEMLDHIDYREVHPEEPPLVVLSTTPIAIPTP